MRNQEALNLKLRTDPANLVKIRRSDWWQKLGDCHTVRFQSVYFDTPDRRLRKLGISLRVRSDGQFNHQSNGLAGDGSTDAAGREWEVLLPDGVPGPSPVIDLTLPPAFLELSASDLQPVFGVDLKREMRCIEEPNAKIECAIDEGAVTAGPSREDVREIELELVSGEMEQLFDAARRLNELTPVHLHLRSKTDIGYALDGGEVAAWSRARKLALSADMTAKDALMVIVDGCLAHLTANDDCARRDLHSEGVHQCRIALRRLRSAFRLYRSVLGKGSFEDLEREVRWLASLMGPARDLDVLQIELLQPAAKSFAGSVAFELLSVRAENARREAYKSVRQALGSARYGRLLVELAAWSRRAQWHADSVLDEEGGLASPLPAFAASRLAALRRKLLKRGRNFETLSTPERHEVRLALKKLRYAVDFFGGIFDGGQRRFSKRMSRLQDDLGHLNDLSVFESTLMRLLSGSGGRKGSAAARPVPDSELGFVAGCLIGEYKQRMLVADEKLIADWRAFAKAKPFWIGADKRKS